MVVYIAGRMRGLEDFGYAKFMAAEKELISEGYTVLNPARLPPDMPIERCMPICLAMLEQADGIYVLNNWMESEGATLELAYAKFQRKHIIYEP